VEYFENEEDELQVQRQNLEFINKNYFRFEKHVDIYHKRVQKQHQE
jgi:hypothetical protein